MSILEKLIQQCGKTEWHEESILCKKLVFPRQFSVNGNLLYKKNIPI